MRMHFGMQPAANPSGLVDISESPGARTCAENPDDQLQNFSSLIAKLKSRI